MLYAVYIYIVPPTLAAFDINDCYGSVSTAIPMSPLWGKRGFIAAGKAI